MLAKALDYSEICFSGRPAFEKITGYIKKAKEAGGEVLAGGSGQCVSDTKVV